MKKLGDFHDGCLEGFWVDDPVVHIFLSDGTERFAIVANGVAALAANEFRKGHIIFDVETKTHEELTSEDIRLLYDVHSGEAGQEQCSKLLKNAQEQKLAALEITPSYGASFIILARSFELLDRRDWSERYVSRLAATRSDLLR
ncbi:MAG: hypothetical protein ABR861_14620 [Terriglobales bacterium]|jgi:hypothetical protein